MDNFRAYRIDRKNGNIVADFTSLTLRDLSAGDVVIRVSHSTINYKDALAATGKGKILRKYPLVGGIDLAGTVVSSSDERFSEGQAVVVNGCGLSETRDGGYAEYARRRRLGRADSCRHERVSGDADRHRRLHRCTCDTPHGTERPAA